MRESMKMCINVKWITVFAQIISDFLGMALIQGGAQPKDGGGGKRGMEVGEDRKSVV